MTIDEKNPSEETLQRALVDLALESIAPAVLAYLTRAVSHNINIEDKITDDELAQIQIILIQQASRDVELVFDSKAKNNITKFKEKLKVEILNKVKTTEGALKNLVCVELNYCEKVRGNWRGKLLFGSGLALATILVDQTGLSLASVLYLLSIGYFDELCEC